MPSRRLIALIGGGAALTAAAAVTLFTHREPATPPPERIAKLVIASPPAAPVYASKPLAAGKLNKMATPTTSTGLGAGGASNVFGPGGLGAGINQALGAGGAHGIGGLGTSGRGAMNLGGKGLLGTGLGGGGVAPTPEPAQGDGYRDWGVNGFVLAKEDRLSTFAVDVDTASYALARRKLREGTLPAPESVRVEEFLNYFHYDYPTPVDGPLAVFLDAAPSPFNPERQLLRVGLQARPLAVSERSPLHLTFLVDVSGSMQGADRLPLAKRALRILLDNLREADTVALVTYAGNVRLVLPPTGISRRGEIAEAIEALDASGSTAMSSGLELAYQQAMKTLDGRSQSRVLVLSDGDANVGATTHEALLAQISRYVKEGVTLSTFGFGVGNYQDALMEQLADKGNGNAYYVDSLFQARRLFQEQLGATMEVVAKDVKVQVEFDPGRVKRYRLVGYENRDVADADFRNDRVDAGEMGAGHTVTALYEVELLPGADAQAAWAKAHVRAKLPRGEVAQERSFPLSRVSARFEDAHRDLRFAAATMATAELLRGSAHALAWPLPKIQAIARDASADRTDRAELVELLERMQALRLRVVRR